MHVLRLDVAVDDAALVGVGERVGEREADAQDVAVRQLAGRLELGQRAPLDELGDQVAARPSSSPASKSGDDRRVVEPRGGERLALARAPARARRRGSTLTATGRSQALVVRRVDRAEAARAEAAPEAVAAEHERRRRGASAAAPGVRPRGVALLGGGHRP